MGVDEAGNASVELPGSEAPPFVPFSTAPRTVSRLVDDAPAPAQPAPPAQHAATPVLDVDEVAETVIDKLRRELLIEREQAGGSMDLI